MMMVRNVGVGTVQARKSLRPAACAIRAPELKGKKKQEKERIPHQSGHAPENPVLERFYADFDVFRFTSKGFK